MQNEYCFPLGSQQSFGFLANIAEAAWSKRIILNGSPKQVRDPQHEGRNVTRNGRLSPRNIYVDRKLERVDDLAKNDARLYSKTARSGELNVDLKRMRPTTKQHLGQLYKFINQVEGSSFQSGFASDLAPLSSDLHYSASGEEEEDEDGYTSDTKSLSSDELNADIDSMQPLESFNKGKTGSYYHGHRLHATSETDTDQESSSENDMSSELDSSSTPSCIYDSEGCSSEGILCDVLYSNSENSDNVLEDPDYYPESEIGDMSDTDEIDDWLENDGYLRCLRALVDDTMIVYDWESFSPVEINNFLAFLGDFFKEGIPSSLSEKPEKEDDDKWLEGMGNVLRPILSEICEEIGLALFEEAIGPFEEFEYDPNETLESIHDDWKVQSRILLYSNMEINEHETFLPIETACCLQIKRKLAILRRIQDELRETQTDILSVIDEEHENRRANSRRARAPSIKLSLPDLFREYSLNSDESTKQQEKQQEYLVQVEQLKVHIDKLSTLLQYVPGLMKVCNSTKYALEHVI